MDVKCGRGAFMKTRGRRPAPWRSRWSRTGNANGVRTEALITAMDAPLGRAVGNALEVQESIDTLARRTDRRTWTELSRGAGGADGAARRPGGVAGRGADARSEAALASGRGLEKFREIIDAQGGDPRVVDDPSRLPTAPEADAGAGRALRVRDRHSTPRQWAGRRMLLGAGRDRVEDAVDPAVGAVLQAKPGDAGARRRCARRGALSRRRQRRRPRWSCCARRGRSAMRRRSRRR